MEATEKYYVTQNNLRKLVFASNIVQDDISELHQNIYNKLDLRPYISIKEVRSLFFLQAFLEQSETYLIAIAEAGGIRTSSQQDNSFIFASGSPKFHTNEFCLTLTNDFENFKIPQEIADRGPQSVSDFREFAALNRRLINDGREDVFIVKLKSQFGLVSEIDKVSFTNSGRASLVLEGSPTDLDQISEGILEVTVEIDTFRKSEAGAKAYKSHMFAPPSILLQRQSLSASEIKLLEMKKELISLITEFIVRTHKPNGSIFSRQLLELYGFKPCGVCCRSTTGRFTLPKG